MFPNNYLFKVKNRNNTKGCRLCSKLTIKTPEHDVVQVSNNSIVDFEQVTVCWKLANNASNSTPNSPRQCLETLFLRLYYVTQSQQTKPCSK